MSKGLKKGLTIGGIVVLVIILAMIAIPFLFKGKIKDAVLDAANKQLNAKVSIEDFGLNLFSNFPNATLTLKNTTVVGVDDFAKDTLLQAKWAGVTIDLSSLFGDSYKVSKLGLDNASVYAKVLADGRTNWDIVKSDSTQTTAATDSSSAFKLSLNKISLDNCNIVYEDLQGGKKLILKNWSGSMSGDLTADETMLATTSTIDEVTFIMDKIPYISKVKGVANAQINANMDKMTFKFINSELQMNDLKASIDGSFGFVGEEDMEFDLKLNAPDTQFKDFLSIVPAMYTDDFKDIKTSGSATVDAYIKGLWQGENYPAFDVKIDVKDAMFQYPSLPKSVNNINVAMTANSPGGSLDKTVVDISKFTFTLGGNPFSATLNVTKPISDPNLKAFVKGTLDLGMIKDVYPLEKGTQLNGKLVADASISTTMSAIDKEQYDQVSASGQLTVTDMIYKSATMQDVLINKAGLEFTPRYVNLSSLNIKIGKNDLAATGKLENFIPYIMKNQTLKGQLNLTSNYLNANDFMGNDTAGTAAADTTAASGEDIIIPKNIDFTLNANMKEIVYNKIDITNLNGAMLVRNGVLSVNNVGANALGGSCKINGTYDTSDPSKPKVNFSLDLNNVSFAQTFKSVETMAKLAPILENLVGSYSMKLNFNTSLGANMMQTLAGLSANGNLQTNDVKVENVEALTKLSSALKTDAFKSFSAKDLNIPFTVKDGRVNTKPFNVNIGDGGLMKLEGSTGLDQSIDYKGTVTLPKQLANSYVNNVPITIGGTFTSPKIGIDTKALVTDAITGLVGGNDKLSGIVNSLTGGGSSANPTEQALKLRTDAKNNSEKLIEAAKEQADNLAKAAGSNPIAKAAAKGAGNKLVDEAKKQGQKLIDEAEIKAKALEANSGAAGATTE